MTKQRSTKRALLMSALSLLLCVSMLVGTTYAWFTDEVVSGMNTIAAGNLDVELYAGDTQVKADTELFKAKLWEPGMVVYENLQVRNVGTLALKYQMTLNVFDENNLEGHKLSEVLKVAVLDKAIESTATRAEILAAAQAATAKDKGLGTLNNLFVKGELEKGESTDYQAVVIYWAPNANEIDNLYNANNGKITSDGQPLHITFGLNLQATQKMSESDSFGTDYDKFAELPAFAKVNDLGPKTIRAQWGLNGDDTTLNAPFILQFQPNETAEECVKGPYKFHNADYVVYADRDVPANSIALAGYYDAWCSMIDDKWVALKADVDIKANEKIRLVSGALGAEVSYKDICEFGNDGLGFLCTAVDLTGENAGTTLTVELRMYKTDSDLNGSSQGDELVPEESFVVGTYTYTFPMTERENVIYVRSAAELQNAVDTAKDESVIAFASNIEGDVVITQRPDVDLTINGCGKSYKGVMTVFGNGNKYGEESLAIKDIKFLAKAGADECIVSPDKKVNNKYSYSHNVTVEGCTFTDPDGAVNCAAIRHEDGGDETWTVRACAVDSTMHSLLQVNNIEESLIVDNCDLNSKNGINLNSTANVTVKNCFFNVKGYCVRFGQSSGAPDAIKTFLLENNTLKTAGDDGAAIVFRGDATTNSTLTLEGNTFVGCEKVIGATADTTIIEN